MLTTYRVHALRAVALAVLLTGLAVTVMGCRTRHHHGGVWVPPHRTPRGRVVPGHWK